ncbi:MAG: TetR/AcrR family transcriptional regulator [Desulfobacterales bacterium]|nr:TetR/AcrR family transcriptional regulator [Desulfobacterales bacterium]
MNNETKQNLLKVTREIIDKHGVEAVSMREVGRCAGLSRSASYRHFKNKQSLLAEIVVEDFHILASMILELESSHLPPKLFLVKFLNTYHGFAMENPEHYNLMLNVMWDKEEYPEIEAIAFQFFFKTREYVDNALSASDSPSHTSKEATAILYAFIHGLVELHLVGHKEISKGFDDHGLLIDKFIDLIF